MYQIALCDDDLADLAKTEKMLSNYQEQHTELDFKIESFQSADALLFAVSKEHYAPDLLLLDIYMPDKIGIATAKELRDMGSKGKIIFLTTSKEHALDAFSVDASQYLVKPVSEKNLFPVLNRLLEDMEEKRRKYLLLKIDGKIHRIAIHEIIYCEAQKKNQYLQLADGTQALLHMTMKDIWEMLSCYEEFARVGISYIINLEHLKSLNSQEMKMDNGNTLFLPRGSYQPLREKYFQYYCETEV